MEKLKMMRDAAGPRLTDGLPMDLVDRFLHRSPDLMTAIVSAFDEWQNLDPQMTYRRPEAELVNDLGEGWCIFYKKTLRAPYVPLSAKGSWIITLHGAVINDSGGYGMLGFGHAPESILKVLAKPTQVIANILTPSLSHGKFQKAIRKEIGRNRSFGCPYAQFLMMNSGSEANAVLDRIIDVSTGHRLVGLLDPSAPPTEPSQTASAGTQGNKSKIRNILTITLEGCFHGRTFKPATWTSSSAANYLKFRCHSINEARADHIKTVSPNDLDALRKLFTDAVLNNDYIELVVFEAVMGEGNPGQKITPEFYKLARQLTIDHGGFLAVDSVQAGFRTHGSLSIVDYPGFENLDVPDFESFSKAINGGQYPISVLALSQKAAKWHKPGIYGNTMTGNPRACDVAVAVMEGMTPELRKNIVDVGVHAVLRFEKLKRQFPQFIEKVTGTGLLYAVHLFQTKFHVTDDIENEPCAEKWMRMNGIGVIHGGDNALRFTPRFGFTKDEVDLQAQMLGKYFEIYGPAAEARVAKTSAPVIDTKLPSPTKA